MIGPFGASGPFNTAGPLLPPRTVLIWLNIAVSFCRGRRKIADFTHRAAEGIKRHLVIGANAPTSAGKVWLTFCTVESDIPRSSTIATDSAKGSG